jgi:hypothetical protein
MKDTIEDAIVALVMQGTKFVSQGEAILSPLKKEFAHPAMQKPAPPGFLKDKCEFCHNPHLRLMLSDFVCNNSIYPTIHFCHWSGLYINSSRHTIQGKDQDDCDET